MPVFKPGEKERIKKAIPVALLMNERLSFSDFCAYTSSLKKKYITKQFYNYLEKELHSLGDKTNLRKIKRLVDYIDDFNHVLNKDSSINKVYIYRKAKMIMDIIDGKRIAMRRTYPNVDQFLSKISLRFNNIKTGALIITKDQYRFLMKFIYDIKDIKDIRLLIRKYPCFVNLKDKNNVHVICNITDAVINILRKKKIKDSLAKLTYYQSVIEVFVTNEHFEIDENSKRLIEEKLYNGFLELTEDKQKLIWLRSISNTLLGKNETLNLNEVIEKFNVHIYTPEEEKQRYRINREGRYVINNPNIITIDGPSTKDMDDAILLEEIDGKYHLSVFISDIASMVRRNSYFDRIAKTKTSSIYLAEDFVIPLFPFKLSHNIGSLIEGVPRNALRYHFVFNKLGILEKDVDISRVRINVGKKYTFDEVNNVLAGYGEEIEYERMLQRMSNLASNLRGNSNRMNFEMYDTFDLGFDLANINTSAHKIIEEFMILTNINDALKFKELKDVPYIYRTHKFERQDELERIRRLFEQVYQDHNLEAIKEIIKILSGTMNNAKYSLVNSGHEALSLDVYSHVTAPVRRYVDLENQRLKYDFIFNEGSLEKLKFYEKYYEKLIPQLNQATGVNRQFEKEYSLIKKTI